MMLLKRLAVGPPSAMRLAVGVTVSEIKDQMVEYLAESACHRYADAAESAVTDLDCVGAHIYCKGMLPGQGPTKPFGVRNVAGI